MSDDTDTRYPVKSFYERLIIETAAERDTFLSIPFIQAALKGSITRDAYIEYLSEAFHHVRHTVPLIMDVRMGIAEERSALHIVLHDYVLERQGHDKLMLRDIDTAGGDAEAARVRDPSPATKALVDFIYDYVREKNPMGYFGMAFVVEGTGSNLATDTVAKLMHSLDLPKNCFRYMLSHGNTELEQMHSFEVLMAQITDQAEQDAIIEVAKRMYGLYGDIFRTVSDNAGFGKG